jgi:PAS domain-containing protein
MARRLLPLLVLIVLAGCATRDEDGHPIRRNRYAERMQQLEREQGKSTSAEKAAAEKSETDLNAIADQAELDRLAAEAAAAQDFQRTMRDADGFRRKP